MSLLKSIAYRLVILAATIVAGGLLSATLARYAPGFGADERQLDARLSSESIQAIRSASREERSMATYYARSLLRLARGDLGNSRSLQRPVRELLAERGAVTLRLVGAGLAIAWGFALLLILLNGPGYLALALVVFPKVHRYLSDLVGATARMSHIVTAKAKGISEVRILCWHVVPVIRREVLALAGVSVGLAISAAIPVEALCGIPGVGQLAWQSALARDIPVLIVVSLLVIAFTVMANSGADLLADERRQLS